MFNGKILIFIFCLLNFLGLTSKIYAQENINCKDKNCYLTIVNPVRGRDLWLNKSIKSLEEQYKAITQRNFSATWLLQYDILEDEEVVSFFKNNLKKNQELGIFLEVSPNLCKVSRVVYPPLVAWYEPQAVFLSGYSREERKKLIKSVFNKFKEKFGKYPNSVGAWWIDSYSLEFMKRKYGIKTVLIAANQQKTDNYTIWGHWWGIPYYPSLANILVPGLGSKDGLDILIIQWAQRDLTKSYGEGGKFSNYSLQANDYLQKKLDTSYFKRLVGYYLNGDAKITQITVGLETGIESVKAFSEFLNQLDFLKEIRGLKSVTMENFYNDYRNLYPKNPEKIILKDGKSEWILTPEERKNEYLKEKLIYQRNLSFSDYFLADKSRFLERKLPINKNENKVFPFIFGVPIFGFLIGFLIFYKSRLIKYFWRVTSFIFISFFTTFLVYPKFGWIVYFGPVIKNVFLIQVILILSYYFLFFLFLKYFRKIENRNLLISCFSLTYGFDYIISILRYTYLNHEHYFGFAWDSLRFFGMKVSSHSISLVNQDFPFVVADSLLKFNFDWIWDNLLVSFFLYPLFHMFLGTVIFLIFKRVSNNVFRKIIFLFYLFLFFFI